MSKNRWQNSNDQRSIENVFEKIKILVANISSVNYYDSKRETRI